MTDPHDADDRLEQLEQEVARLDAIARRQDAVIELLIGDRSLTEATDDLGENVLGGGTQTVDVGGPNWRDVEVFEQLEPGQRVSGTQLKQLYRTHTDLRDQKKIREYAESVTQTGPFEETTGVGVWVYTGEDDE